MVGPNSMEGTEMPAYNIRHSIATKVAAKKTAKGYTLSDENCDACEMPLMTLNGKSECKVCPAIKKWVQRKEEADRPKQVIEARDTEETTVMEEEEEVRDEAPSVDVESYADEAPAVESYADSTVSIDVDVKSECEIVDSNSEESLGEHLMRVKESASEESDDRFLSKSESEESEDTEAIRARARQIIMDARGRGEWGAADSDDDDDDDDDDAGMTSPELSWNDSKEESVEDFCIQDRAGEIINQARKNLRAEHGLSDFPPEEILSPRIAASSSSGINEVTPGMGSWEAATKIQSLARRYLAKELLLSLMREEIKKYQDEEEKEANEASSFENFEPVDCDNENADIQEYRSEDWGNNDNVQQDAIQGNDQGVAQDGEQYVVEDVTREDEEPVAQEEVAEPVAEEVVDDVPKEIEEDETQAQEYVAQDPTEDVVEDVTAPNPPDDGEDTKRITEEAPGVGPDMSPQQVPQMEEVPQQVPQMDPRQYPQQAPQIVLPQQVPVSDYAAVLQSPNDPNTRALAALAPSRGFFTQMACKFDDAVTDAIGKVHSIVTCSIGEPNKGAQAEGCFGDAFDAEQSQFDPANNGEFIISPANDQFNHDAQASVIQAKYDAQVMFLTMNGWRVGNISCNQCNRAVMIRPEDGQMMCASCDDVTSNPAAMAAPTGPPRPELVANQVPPRPEQAANQVPPCPEQVGSQQPAMNRGPPRPEQVASQHPITNPSPPRPAPVANRAINHGVQSQQYSIEMNRRFQLGWVAMNTGCPYCNSQLMRKPNDNMDHCLACGPIFTEPSNTITTPSMAAMRSFTPLNGMNNVHQNFSATPNANPLRDVTAAHYGAVAGPAKPPMAPSMPMPTNQAHPAPNTSYGAPPMPQYALSPQIAHLRNQIQMMQVAQGSWAQPDDAKENSSGDANVSQQLQEAKLRIEDAKKFILSRNNRRMTPSSGMGMPPLNRMMTPSAGMHPMANMNGMTPSSGVPMMANMNPGVFRPNNMTPSAGMHPMANMHGMTPSSSMPKMANMNPGIQVFRPNAGMTPSAQECIQPMMNSMAPGAQASVFRPQMQMSMVTTPGAEMRSATPQMRAMGSLMSPGTDTNANVAKMTGGNQVAQQATYQEPTPEADPATERTASTENDGYRTPQMPGKYFFA